MGPTDYGRTITCLGSGSYESTRPKLRGECWQDDCHYECPAASIPTPPLAPRNYIGPCESDPKTQNCANGFCSWYCSEFFQQDYGRTIMCAGTSSASLKQYGECRQYGCSYECASA